MPLSRWRPIVLGCALPILWGLPSPAAGAANDAAVHVPPGYNSFLPPLVGASYTDPVYGTSIKRLSDAVNMPNDAGSGELLWVGTEYPTASPFNSDNSRLILQHQSYVGLYDGSGAYLRDLPFAVNAGSEPRWSRTDPKVLYYVSGNDLMRVDVATAISTLVHSFGEYAAIRGRGESDISRDGNHFVFAADEIAGLANRYVFVYEISTDTKGPVLDTIGHSFNNLYIAPSNSVAIGWIPTGTARFTGVELFDRNMVFQRQLTHAIGHQHLTRDTNGDDVLIWNNSNDPPPAPCQNGIVKVRLSDAHQTCLLLLDFSLAVHITAPDGNGWAFVETYAPGNPSPSSSSWKPYTNEILQVKLDGTETWRLLHHRSRPRPADMYTYQPRAAVSRDGSRLVFTSNYDLQAIIPANPYTDSYADAYFVAVHNPTPTFGFSFSAPSYAVTERAGVATIAVKRSAGSGALVDYATADGTATGAGLDPDYTPTPGTLTFGAGKTTAVFRVPITRDTIDEGDETVILRLTPTGGAGGGGAGSTAVLTIRDDDTGGKIGFSSANYAVSEGAGPVKLTVKRSGGLASGVSVHYATEAGTATGGGMDYGDAAGDLTFASSGTGATTQTLTIPITQDALAEGAETFKVALSSPTSGGALGSPTVATVTILDDEPTVEFSASSYSAKESQANALVTVKRSGLPAGVVTVSYATGGGSATAGVDYRSASGTLVFGNGVTSRTFVVPMIKDTLVEGPETVGLTLSNPVGIVRGGRATATLTIVDDEAVPTLQFSGPTYTVNEATPRATLLVRRTGTPTHTVTVDYVIAGSTATNGGVDYDLVSPGTVTFAAGVTSRTILVPIVNDTFDEGTETVDLLLQNPQDVTDPGPLHAVLGTPSAAKLRIVDNETTVQLSASAYGVSEASTSLTISVRRTGSLAGSTTVSYDVPAAAPGTATRDTGGGGDYKLNNVANGLPGTLTFLPGQAVKTFTVNLNSDTVAEGSETVNLALGAPTSARLGTPSTATVTLRDNDTAGKVQFSAASYSVAETAGPATITVTRAGGVSSEATVLYTVTSGSSSHPAAGADFDPVTGVPLVFGLGETSKTMSVGVHDNGTPDAGAVSVDLLLDTPSHGLVLGPTPTATLWIVRN